MAGHPPDGRWQSVPAGGQDQARAAWQPPPPEQPAPGAYQPNYPPPPGAYRAPEAAPAWEQPEPGSQPGWQQAPPGGPGAAGYPGYQAPGAGSAQARQAMASHGKGFVASLFDFQFKSFVTPKIVKGLYVLATAWVLLWAIFFILVGFNEGHVGGGLIVLIFFVPVFVLLSLGSIRVFLELFMALHRINENIQAMRDQRDDQG
ncbi:MAG TPA: DUF4282 domain-containing protein [Trebonia sp.]|jgi:hypothetical protein|nr:DUF4282 domain-containing protein [Trebonia sp.]